MKTIFSTIFALGVLHSGVLKAQLDSIYNQSKYRTYIVHTPTNYTSGKQYPLVLNFHGLNSTAASQQLYTQFNPISDTAGFIVVYPNGVNNTWNFTGFNGPDDVKFISALIDTLKKDFSINSSCVYATGMSMGAFMCYKLSCDLSSKIAAIAPVSGNMTTIQKNSCSQSKKIPVLHIHGTSDNVVSYNGQIGITDVPTTIDWWRQTNNCSSTPVVTAISNINTSDGATADRYYYKPMTSDSAEVIFYKVTGGGHTWPGAFPSSTQGNTCEDFSASAVIWAFFKKHCAMGTNSIKNDETTFELDLFPNPATDKLNFNITVDAAKERLRDITVFNTLGVKILAMNYSKEINSVNIAQLPEGIYFIGFRGEKSMTLRKFIKVR